MNSKVRLVQRNPHISPHLLPSGNTHVLYQNRLWPRPHRESEKHGKCEHFQDTREHHASWD